MALSKNNNGKKIIWIIIICFFAVLSPVLGWFAFKSIANSGLFVLSGADKAAGIFKKPFSAGGSLGGNQSETETCSNLKGTSPKEIDCARRNIDGVYVEPGQENLFPIAAIIENHIDARPPSALSRANLVIEAEAEGGITRFLAVYADGSEIKEIGPIRSARPYFVDWARELSALFIHCGGSPEALVKIARENVFDLNEFYNGTYFWRGKSRPAPHNVYTSTENLNGYLENKKAGEGKYLSWQFKDDAALPEGEIGKNVKIKFKTPDYYVDWVYNKESNGYIRYLAGQKHKDADGVEITAKNVIVMYVKAEVIDDESRLKMQHIGSGKAIVCLDGKCEEGSWEKKSGSARIRFYAGDNEEFKFNAGAAWIEVVRPEREVIIK
ncbi:DUF3048 domain-containing protein [Patescibacteria group bacterium]|nr:DUF3048 domain-containing protein [Patescibacteria group bacterium]